MNNIGIYARVSDDKKKSDGERRQDINRQLEVLRQFLKSKGINEWSEYIDDGKSAFTDDLNQRPAFKKLRIDWLRFHIKEIYIEDMTRFSRNLEMGIQWLKELSDNNIQLTSIKEGEIEATSTKGWLQSVITLLFAEWESRIRSEKVKSGMQKAKNLGKKIGGFRGGRKHVKSNEGENRSLKR